MDRYLYPHIKKDLSEKMVFIGGPRQVGKTTLSLQFLESGTEKHPAYLNWDSPVIRKDLRPTPHQAKTLNLRRDS